MALYWRRYRRRYPNWRRRKNYQRRRPYRRRYFRRAFQRRFRRHTVRRRRFYHKKLSKLIQKQWQPKHIRKCKIKGDIVLFICGQKKIAHDFTMYKESMTPVGEASGGGWSIQQFTLDALYTEYMKYRNFWTAGNQGLPLVRYTGCQFKLYKSEHTDYIASFCICPPFSVTRDMFLNTQPQRQLFERYKVIVPKKTSGTRKKYKKIKLKPPSLMTNKWYFQQDLATTPLVLMTVAACSFDQPYCPNDQISNNITLISLNLDVFQNPNFESWDNTQYGYVPKMLGTQHMHLFGRANGSPDPPQKWSQAIPLTNTNTYATANTPTQEMYKDAKKAANPFSLPFSHPDEKIYYQVDWPKPSTNGSLNLEETKTFTAIDSLFWECRYNPDKDKGIGNKVYLKANNRTTEGTMFTLPSKEEHLIIDFPLWLIFWGWHDYILKTTTAQHMDQSYMFLVQSPYITPKKPAYLFLDKYFWDLNQDRLNNTDRLKWHPKTEMQEEIEFYFAQGGPFAPKINTSQSIQANAHYSFYFKWGGCPAPMENITSPALQDKFPVPSNKLQTNEIQDPKTAKQTFLYDWDERRQTITKSCAKRITGYSTPTKYFTGISALDLPFQAPQTESEEETTSEEEEPPLLQQQLKLLRRKQRQLKQQLLELSKRQKLE
nr:MAG: ORF1 [TTV-like mini virus]UGV39252.1 MAG: ORF1 [TTV-like mini virus]